MPKREEKENKKRNGEQLRKRGNKTKQRKKVSAHRLKYRQQCFCIVTELSGTLPNMDNPYKSIKCKNKSRVRQIGQKKQNKTSFHIPPMGRS